MQRRRRFKQTSSFRERLADWAKEIREQAAHFPHGPDREALLKRMRDIQAHLEKLHIQLSECELIRDLATDPQKRELFARLAEHHKVLVAEIERVIPDKSGIVDKFLGRKTQEPFPREEEA